MKILMRLFVCLLLLVPAACGEQSSQNAAQPAQKAEPASQQDDLAAEAEAYIRSAWPADGPGGAVIVTRNGETVFAGAQGLADVETNTELTPDSVFRIGSVTKQFAAAVVMQLVEEGKVNLDDPMTKYLPDFPAPPTITVRMLLNHTSGIKSYTELPDFMSDEDNTGLEYTTEELVDLTKDLPLDFEPGSRFAYNNSGYVLVGAVIEAVTGNAWYEEIDTRIAQPLMLDTLRSGIFEDETPEMATGYTGEDEIKPAQIIHMSMPNAAGALISNVKDLATWGNALHHGKVVSAESYAQMIEPTTLSNGETTPYGFGLSNSEVRGHKSIGHGGGIYGYLTSTIYVPEEDLFVAVIVNSDRPATSPGLAGQRLTALALGDPYPVFTAVEVDPETLEPLLGVYRKDETTANTFYSKDGKLFCSMGRRDLEVLPAGDDVFFVKNNLTWFKIVRAEDGAHVMEFHSNGDDEAQLLTWEGPPPAEEDTP